MGARRTVGRPCASGKLALIMRHRRSYGWSPRMKRACLAAIVVALTISAAVAQSYPTRTVTMVVPFGAGGPTDALARIVAERMRNALGQSVVVENVTGASGTIGTT